MSISKKCHHAQQIAAGAAIGELRQLAERGDLEAVAALRNVALSAIDTLKAIPLGNVPQQSPRWPVAYDAIHERRKVDMAQVESLEVGSGIGIKLTGKRVFRKGKPAAFALETFRVIEPVRMRGKAILEYLKRHPDSPHNWRDRAAKLAPLSHSNLPEWAAVAMEFWKEVGMNRWDLVPIPDSAQTKIGKDPSGDGWTRDEESALLEKISSGLKSLIP